MKSLAFFVVWTLFFTLLFGVFHGWLAPWIYPMRHCGLACLLLCLSVYYWVKKTVTGHRKNNFDGITYVKGKGFKRQTSRFPFNLY